MLVSSSVFTSAADNGAISPRRAPGALSDRHFYAQWTTAAKIEADQWSPV
jgi:hypothetical protein